MKHFFSLFIFIYIGFTLSAQPLSSSNLPIVVINTNGQTIPNDYKVNVKMGIIYKDDQTRNEFSSSFNHFDGNVGIELRGQSSQDFPMKSYSIEVRDFTGTPKDVSIFGMPQESDWVLYAPYTDKSLTHNFLAYTLSNEMGHWAAHCKYVELVVDNDYKGIYVFMEKIKRSFGRLGLEKLTQSDNSGDAVTGGYIFSLDKNPDGWISQYPVPASTDQGKRQFSYVYPKIEEITTAQKEYIKSAMDQFENVANSSYRQNPFTGMNKYIDFSSFVDYYILQEVSRNVDGLRFSNYYHKNKNSINAKIFAGPVWDFDIAFHNANYCNGSLTTGWALDGTTVCLGDATGGIPFYWNNLIRRDSIFKSMIYCHWNKFRSNVLSETHINHLIDSISDLTAEARTRHFVRWPILGVFVWPNPQPIPLTYEEEITQLKDWMHARLEWLDNNFPQNGYCWPEQNPASFTANLYPNPIGSVTNIKINSKYYQQVYIKAYDIMGKLKINKPYNLKPGDNLISNLNTSAWIKGIYIIRVINETGENFTFKVIK
jgi:hypothetical protein